MRKATMAAEMEEEVDKRKECQAGRGFAAYGPEVRRY